MKIKDNMNIYVAFIIGIGFTICLLAITELNKQNTILQTQIDELHLLFNQKFLQEMVIDKPELRTLEYRPTKKTELLRISI
jgi:hypothetical protein